MMVIPTDEEVVLEFVNTWAENVGWLLSGLGLTGAGYLFVRDRLNRVRKAVPTAP
jgi:hypothetical protein